MNVNNESRIVFPLAYSRVMLQIVASLTDDSRGVIYNGNMFLVQASEHGLPLGPEGKYEHII